MALHSAVTREELAIVALRLEWADVEGQARRVIDLALGLLEIQGKALQNIAENSSDQRAIDCANEAAELIEDKISSGLDKGLAQ